MSDDHKPSRLVSELRAANHDLMRQVAALERQNAELREAVGALLQSDDDQLRRRIETAHTVAPRPRSVVQEQYEAAWRVKESLRR